MQRWSSILFFVLCYLHGLLAYTEPFYEVVEEDTRPEDFATARNLLKQDGRVFTKRGTTETHLERQEKFKENFDGSMPGVLRFGKRSGAWEKRESSVQKKEMPGVLRFGKRSIFDEKKSVPGVLRFGKRDALLEKREIPGVLRFGKRDYIDELLEKRSEVPGVLRFGKRDVPGVLRFGKRSDFGEHYAGILLKKSVPGVLRFGRK